jgi:hypothetical protein
MELNAVSDDFIPTETRHALIFFMPPNQAPTRMKLRISCSHQDFHLLP